MQSEIEYSVELGKYVLTDIGENHSTFLKVEGKRNLQNEDIVAFGTSIAGASIKENEFPPSLTLHFYAGPRVSEVLTFPSTEVVKVGKVESESTISILDEDMSRRQCVFRYESETGWVVLDGDGSGHGSHNGTW